MEPADTHDYGLPPIRPYSRGPQILKLLYEHGPLTASAIGDLIHPTMDSRRVRDAMQRLRFDGLILQKYAAEPKSQSVFYQISAREEHRKKIAELVGVEESKLLDLRVRDQELYHSMDCARWAEFLKRKFPSASVIRENRFHSDPNAKDVLLIEFDDFQLKPDILLSIPSDGDAMPLNIAFEIERSRKSPKRIERKLRNFAQGTRVDGIVYATNDDGIQELVRKVWLNRNLHRGTKIEGYPGHYMMFAPNAPHWIESNLHMWNAKREVTWLEPWLQTLSEHSRRKRLDEHFKPSADGG